MVRNCGIVSDMAVGQFPAERGGWLVVPSVYPNVRMLCFFLPITDDVTICCHLFERQTTSYVLMEESINLVYIDVYNKRM